MKKIIVANFLNSHRIQLLEQTLFFFLRLEPVSVTVSWNYNLTNSEHREIEFNNSGSLAVAASRKRKQLYTFTSTDKEKHNFGWQRTCISLSDVFLWCDLLCRQSAQLLKFDNLGII